MDRIFAKYDGSSDAFALSTALHDGLSTLGVQYTGPAIERLEILAPRLQAPEGRGIRAKAQGRDGREP